MEGEGREGIEREMGKERKWKEKGEKREIKKRK